jgi:hypothetical protein
VENEPLESVFRKYLLHRGDDGLSERVLDDVEEWCFGCRTHYPHDPAV